VFEDFNLSILNGVRLVITVLVNAYTPHAVEGCGELDRAPSILQLRFVLSRARYAQVSRFVQDAFAFSS
jgi:hypothetical protein